MALVKSKQRVADHGEVFTPAWMVEAMLDLVKGETEGPRVCYCIDKAAWDEARHLLAEFLTNIRKCC